MKAKVLLLFLLISMIFNSCKKESSQEEESPPTESHYILKLRNKNNSEHVIQLFQTRSGNDFMDVEDKDWSENHLGIANFVAPDDSVYINFDQWQDSYVEYRLGVITPEGPIVNLDEQEGYTFGYYPHFGWPTKDTMELALTIVTDNTGFIYIRDY